MGAGLRKRWVGWGGGWGGTCGFGEGGGHEEDAGAAVEGEALEEVREADVVARAEAEPASRRVTRHHLQHPDESVISIKPLSPRQNAVFSATLANVPCISSPWPLGPSTPHGKTSHSRGEHLGHVQTR